jgi:ribosomal-protein-alanine N-acetyltransferase
VAGGRNKMQLETERLILRSFREDDVDSMAQLFANPDFMRFSLGVFTERKQTVGFVEKVIGWDSAGIPSQFAVVPRSEDAIIGYCGFLYHPEHAIEDIEIGYRLHPDYWNRGLITEAARAIHDHGFRDWKLSRVISLIHPENIPVTSRGGKKWNERREENYVSRFSDAGVCDNSRGVAGEACRSMNSRARARYAWAAAPLGAYSRMDFPKLGASLKRTLRGITV